VDLVYQLLALDPSEKNRTENAISLLYLVRGFTRLWKNPKVFEADCRIADGRSTLSVVAIEEAGESDELGRAFIVTLTGPYEDIENLREPLAAFLKVSGF